MSLLKIVFFQSPNFSARGFRSIFWWNPELFGAASPGGRAGRTGGSAGATTEGETGGLLSDFHDNSQIYWGFHGISWGFDGDSHIKTGNSMGNMGNMGIHT